MNIINECALEIDNCSDHAYCVDYIFGYECVCYSGFTDLQPSSPGQICAKEQPCCKSFKFHLYHLSFVTAICTIQSRDLNGFSYTDYTVLHHVEISRKENSDNWLL